MPNLTMGTTTTLIDSTSDSNCIYIGTTTIFAGQQPLTTSAIWEIQRVTLSDGKAVKIETAWPANVADRPYFVWDNRASLTYK